MIAVLVCLLVLDFGVAVYFGVMLLKEAKQTKELKTKLAEQTSRAEALEAELTSLKAVPSHPLIEEAQLQADEITTQADNYMAEVTQWVETAYESAAEQAAQFTENAEKQAQEALAKKEAYEKTAQAMKNVIEGYGDRYLVSGKNLLDGLAEKFSSEDAGAELKKARAHSRELVEQKKAAACDYADVNRREAFTRLVLDAFNGRVDSSLSVINENNAWALEQEIRDAFSLTNFNGKAFKDARITEEYLASRLNELKWAATALQLGAKEKKK